LSFKKEPHDLALLIPAAVEDMAHRAGGRPIQVRVPDSLPPAECDKNMMLRVLKQLLNNALKYSPEDSLLTVSAEFTGAAIVIDIVDRGPGVAEDERDLIFEKYYRGRAGRADMQGTGLGLPAAKCIVRAHGGEIWVTSPPEGGAAFHVSLPIANGSPIANDSPVAQASPRVGAV
jgi:two-component system sensor histidine kinase KdpD